MENKTKYEAPIMEIVGFNNEDILSESVFNHQFNSGYFEEEAEDWFGKDA